MNALQHKTFINDLFYLLAGFDTQNVFVTSDPPSLSSNLYDLNVFNPFELLIYKVREFYSCEACDSFVQEYLEKLAKLKDRTNTVEELYVALQSDIEVFRDLEKMLKAFRIDKNNKELLFNNKENKPVGILPAITARFQTLEARELLSGINRWINMGEPTNLIEIHSVDGFSSVHWTDMCKIKQVDLPKRELQKIEECGKVLLFSRMLFEIELVGDERLASGDSQSLNDEINRYKDLIDSDTFILNKNKHLTVLQPFCYNNNIQPWRDVLIDTFSKLISSQILTELTLIENIVLLQCNVIYHKLFSNIANDMFNSQNIIDKLNRKCHQLLKTDLDIQQITKIGTRVFSNFEFIKIAVCESSFGNYVMKLLNFQQVPPSDSFLTNFQRLGIQFCPSLLQYFVAEKTFIELKILFRFLFSVNTCILHIQVCKTYNFIRVIHLILLKVKESGINCTDKFFRSNTDDCLTHFFAIDEFVSEFSTYITELLSKFHLTTQEIFRYWAELFDITHEFLSIEYKDCILTSGFNTRVKAAVLGLMSSIQRSCGDTEFTEYLKNLDVDKYL